MITALQDNSNWLESGKPDAILFSGGGNDVAGDQFCVFLDYANPAPGGLNETRFEEALGMVKASYQGLPSVIALPTMFRYSATATIFRYPTERIRFVQVLG